LLITDRFWFVGLFAHMVGCLVWLLGFLGSWA
jgi:hypothetical protein